METGDCVLLEAERFETSADLVDNQVGDAAGLSGSFRRIFEAVGGFARSGELHGILRGEIS